MTQIKTSSQHTSLSPTMSPSKLMELPSDEVSYKTSQYNVIYGKKDEYVRSDDSITLIVGIASFVLCCTCVFSIMAKYLMNKNKRNCENNHDQSAENLSGVCKLYIYILIKHLICVPGIKLY